MYVSQVGAIQVKASLYYFYAQYFNGFSNNYKIQSMSASLKCAVVKKHHLRCIEKSSIPVLNEVIFYETCLINTYT